MAANLSVERPVLCLDGLSMRQRRAFTALWPPPEITSELEEFFEETRLRTLAPHLHWNKPHRWHVTTAFFPDIRNANLTALEDQLVELAARTAPFDIRLAGAGVFGRAGFQTPVWIGVDGQTDALARLAMAGRRAAARVDVRHESGKRFTPHVTVARSAELFGLELWLERLDRFSGSPWEVTEFLLVESFLSTKDKPPRYESLGRFPLTG